MSGLGSEHIQNVKAAASVQPHVFWRHRAGSLCSARCGPGGKNIPKTGIVPAAFGTGISGFNTQQIQSVV